MNAEPKPDAIYDLSNLHFANSELILKDNTTLKGAFVRFCVSSGSVQYLYPSEELCFLPEKHQAEFWRTYVRNKGEFAEFPAYVKRLGLDDIRQITIKPKLVI